MKRFLLIALCAITMTPLKAVNYCASSSWGYAGNAVTGGGNATPTLVTNETQLKIGDKHLRCDTVLYNKAMHPQMIIEYKAPTIQIQQKTFDQIVAYNLLLRADYLVVSNGLQHYCCRMDYEQNSYGFLREIPDYQSIAGT